MNNFCTLFNANYLSRGLALYESLLNSGGDFHLYVFAFDDASYEYLSTAGLRNLTAISLREFEDHELLRIKPTRSAAEYCWTCTPSTILYCIRNFDLAACTYLDADMYFYQDPRLLFAELGHESILITEHRYSKQYNQAEKNGIYCVQFMYFRNTPDGLAALTWWRERCIEWCYGRLEDGKFGDQKYLDDWPTRFKGVHILKHPGGGVAPWNIQHYELSYNTRDLMITSRDHKTYPLVFFHFHGLKFYTDDHVSYSGSLYTLRENHKMLLFRPYVEKLKAIESRLRSAGVTFGVSGAFQPAPAKTVIFRQFLIESLAKFKETKKISFLFRIVNFKDHYHFEKTKPLNKDYGLSARS